SLVAVRRQRSAAVLGHKLLLGARREPWPVARPAVHPVLSLRPKYANAALVRRALQRGRPCPSLVKGRSNRSAAAPHHQCLASALQTSPPTGPPCFPLLVRQKLEPPPRHCPKPVVAHSSCQWSNGYRHPESPSNHPAAIPRDVEPATKPG